MEDLRKFSDTKLSYDERVSSLAKTLTPGRALEVNGVKYLSLDGGRTIQYEIPLGEGALRGVVDQANLPKLTEFQDLMERSRGAVADPAKFQARMDRVLHDLGAEKVDFPVPPAPEVGGEAGRTITLSVGGKDVLVPTDIYQGADYARIWSVQNIIDHTPNDALRELLATRFEEAIKDPVAFDEFAKKFGE
jgi:hypothetical protein